MSVRFVSAAMRTNLPPMARWALVVLANEADDRGGTPVSSADRSTLIETGGFTHPEATAWLLWLSDQGHISKSVDGWVLNILAGSRQ